MNKSLQIYDSKGRCYSEDQIAAIREELERRVTQGPSFYIKGYDAKTLAAKLSQIGEADAVMREIVALYGLELVIADDAKKTLELRDTWQAVLALHVAKTVGSIELKDGVWYDYNITFRLDGDIARVAMEGLAETSKRGVLQA